MSSPMLQTIRSRVARPGTAPYRNRSRAIPSSRMVHLAAVPIKAGDQLPPFELITDDGTYVNSEASGGSDANMDRDLIDHCIAPLYFSAIFSDATFLLLPNGQTPAYCTCSLVSLIGHGQRIRCNHLHLSQGTVPYIKHYHQAWRNLYEKWSTWYVSPSFTPKHPHDCSFMHNPSGQYKRVHHTGEADLPIDVFPIL